MDKFIYNVFCKISLRYSFLLILIFFFCSCKKIAEEKDSILSRIVNIDYSPLKGKISTHNLPSAEFTVRLKNLSNENLEIPLDSLRDVKKYTNFVLILEKEGEPYYADLKFIGVEKKSNENNGKEDENISKTETSLILDKKDSVDLFFRYNKNEMLNILNHTDSLDQAGLEKKYMDYLRRMLQENEIYLFFKIKNKHLIAELMKEGL